MPWMALTDVGTILCSRNGYFQWTVRGNNYNYKNYFLESPCFSFQNFEWKLILVISSYYCYKSRKQRKTAELFFKRKHLNNSIGKFDVNISIKLFGTHSYEWKCKRSERETDPEEGERRILRPYNTFLDAFFSQVPLKFSCTIRKLDSDDNNGNSENNETAKTNSKSAEKSNTEQVAVDKKMPVPRPKRMYRLVQNLENMFLEGQNTDMILKVGNTEFPAHKNILSARCNIFANMFQHDMTEKNSNVVDIVDCSPEAFKVFLLFLYTGSVSTISADTVCNVYYAADKYQVDDLKEDCIEFMKKTLSVETVCDVVALSLLHSESELLTLATGFFRDNLRKILKTVQWQKYMKDHPTHANELLIKSLDA